MSSGNDLLDSSLLLYAIPSLFALTTKCLIVWLARYSLKSMSPWLWGLILSLFMLNIFELLAFIELKTPQYGLQVLTCYYTFALLSVASYLGIALEINQQIKRWSLIALSIPTVFSLLVLLTPGAALAGISSIGYSITRVAGPYYWVIQLYIIVTFLIAIALLTYGITTNKSKYQSRKSLVMLIAFSPVVLVIFVVMLLMQLGFAINASIVLPLAINFSLAILLYTEKEHRLFLFLSAIPRTEEHQSVKKVTYLLHKFPTLGLDEVRATFEQEIALMALKQSDGNQSAAARLLSTSLPTLRRKLKKESTKRRTPLVT